MAENLQNNSGSNHFEIIRQLKREVLIKAPCLYQDPERAKILEIILCKRDAVLSAQAVPGMASLAIQFDPVKLPLKNLFELLDTLLANIGSKVRETVQQLYPHRSMRTAGRENIFKLKISGMSCDCCAVSLEMNLKRESSIRAINVDFTSATARIIGDLTPQEALEQVQRYGFTACIA